ncbi:hypothetical protein [Roseivivax isoporae]|uniref:Uncharacterized protein n=1 Tax=Roseivivax isoporae LMG 25204 TaxID=1449351 RepID=X7FBH3_9RHOB|nr:hypothetical protein [Roseivivax isoporae]ETX29461.1 hypothetical protein RISW2_23280 [Roseivivax isoporae LMG 25204]
MPRWAWFLPVGCLVALAAVLGWRQGWIHANVTETQVIAAYAERYLSDRAAAGTAESARPSDCRARPGTAAGVWLVVICGPEPYDPARHYTYYVTRAGGLSRVVGPQDT